MTHKKTVLEILFNNKELSDLEISVRPNGKNKTFSGNRAIFAAKSEIFKTMFYGQNSMIESLNGDLVIDDISVPAFECFMKEIYELQFEINQNIVGELWYSAKKYMMPQLQEKCIEFVQNVKDLSKFMLTIKHISSCGLMDDVLALFKGKVSALEHGVKLLNHEIFLELHKDVVIAIISHDQLLSDEYSIWQKCIEWCKQNTSENSDGKDDEKAEIEDSKHDNLTRNKDVDWKITMKQFIPFIRFNNMDAKYFMNNVASLGVLSDTEQKEIAFRFLDPQHKTCFNQNHRWIDYISIGSMKILKSLSDGCKNVEIDDYNEFQWKNVSWQLSGSDKYQFSFEVRKLCQHGTVQFGIRTADETYKSYIDLGFHGRVNTPGIYSFKVGFSYWLHDQSKISFSTPATAFEEMTMSRKCKKAYPVIRICADKQCEHKNQILINKDFTKECVNSYAIVP